MKKLAIIFRVPVASALTALAMVGIQSCSAMAASTRANKTPDVNRVSGIEEWEQKTRLPGFTLLDRADLPGYYICVYETGLREIAFCYYQKKPEAANRHSFAVYDTDGRNLQDPARWNKSSELNKPGDTYFIPGMVVPLRPDYAGAIQVEFKSDSGSGLQPVYKKRLPYNSDSEQGRARQSATAPDLQPESNSKSNTDSEGRSR